MHVFRFVAQNFVTKNNNVDNTPFSKIDQVEQTKMEVALAATTTPTSHRTFVAVKRTNDQQVQCDTHVKKPHLNGDTLVAPPVTLKSNAIAAATATAAVDDEPTDDRKCTAYRVPIR